MGALLSLCLHYLVLSVCICICVCVSASASASASATNDTLISQDLFWELEELARIVDITYCVGTAGLGIRKPFSCASRCGDRDFETFELVTVSRVAGAAFRRCRPCAPHFTSLTCARHGTLALSYPTPAAT
jgi:hypothetical protein